MVIGSFSSWDHFSIWTHFATRRTKCFCFSQGATQPTLLRALPAGVTAAICDTLLILLAVFGLSLIVLQFEWLRITLMIMGIIFYFIWAIAFGVQIQ